MNRLLLTGVLLTCVSAPSRTAAQGTIPREEAPAPLAPHESLGQFTIAEGLDIGLVVSEPQIAQPLSISFDDRGRMWVLQYRQFPNPNGLQPVKVDNWLRTVYDKLPDPPPKGPKGNDRISICEDTDGDGRVDHITHFLSDLNLASGMALGYDGVFVAQPPYLLFYADRDHDDVPDGDPEVLLTGFGMNDAHAFANSLTWGPDGWLYGAQGSTATADIRGIGFQQGVWRYHPRTREFELFAEGGGNTWGIDFDQFGNLFAGGNTVEPLVHHVQGAYYVKGFGKHGPLHNPHAYGYFQPVRHHGYAGDSLTGGFVLYQGGAFPERFDGACIAPNTRHSASRWSTLESTGSTFATRAAGDFITSEDIWFRPVDSTIGPDGALYVADWYDYNISHSSPKNRSKWYQPSRDDGRIWRVAPAGVKPVPGGTLDLSKQSSSELIALFSHSNEWYARQAIRRLAERRDTAVLDELEALLSSSDERLALRALWSLSVSGGLDEQLAGTTLGSRHEYVRAWTVRLLGDTGNVSPQAGERLARLAREDSSVIVRSQLASTAKRLPAEFGVPIVAQLLRHSEDANDVHLPLLIWWAIEAKAIAHPDMVLQLFSDPDDWQLPLLRDVIVERLARRFAAEGTEDGFAACARLIALAPADVDVDRVLAGMVLSLAGRRLETRSPSLESLLAKQPEQRRSDPRVIELALRAGIESDAAVNLIEDSRRPDSQRVEIIRALGETRTTAAIAPLLRLTQPLASEPIQSAAFTALGYFDDPQIPAKVVANYADLTPTARARAIDLLCGRREWARTLLAAMEATTIESTEVSPDQVRQLLAHGDERLNEQATSIWGRVRPATPLEQEGRINAVVQLLGRAAGDIANGARLFEKTCATCHKLHGEGITIGPDLTGAERRVRRKLVENIVDPNAEIRPQFVSHIAATRDGRIVTGLLAEATADTITLLDATNKRLVLRRIDIEELRESPTSLMPENLLDQLTDQEIRDLIAFVQSP